MAFKILYPDENPQVHRHSSIDQFEGFLSVMIKGGWAPIVFDQLDGVTCTKVKHHPVIISWSNDIGFIYPEAHCSYASDKFVYFDESGVEQRLLPPCFGGKGEFYDFYTKSFSFANFDDDTTVGAHNTKTTRTGLDYVQCVKTLPAVD